MPTPSLDLSILPTMRSISFAAARIYDLLGWFSQATIPVKILLQTFSIHKLGWDDHVPDDLATWCMPGLSPFTRLHPFLFLAASLLPLLSTPDNSTASSMLRS